MNNVELATVNLAKCFSHIIHNVYKQINYLIEISFKTFKKKKKTVYLSTIALRVPLLMNE